jgi:hypothetical protein
MSLSCRSFYSRLVPRLESVENEENVENACPRERGRHFGQKKGQENGKHTAMTLLLDKKLASRETQFC